VQSFASGEEAITHLSDISRTEADDGWRPLLCIVDVKMPGFHGAEVLQWIREHDSYAAMPVVMCSSSDDPKDVSAAAQFGAQCYARKYPSPADFRELIACARRFSGQSGEKFEVTCNLLVSQPPDA
jgi:DNA-binding NarL/FixJ family response regulator